LENNLHQFVASAAQQTSKNGKLTSLYTQKGQSAWYSPKVAKNQAILQVRRKTILADAVGRM